MATDIAYDLSPQKWKEEYFAYLDELERDLGETNMFGAKPYLIGEFDLGLEEATEVLKEWMDTYAERHND